MDFRGKNSYHSQYFSASHLLPVEPTRVSYQNASQRILNSNLIVRSTMARAWCIFAFAPCFSPFAQHLRPLSLCPPAAS